MPERIRPPAPSGGNPASPAPLSLPPPKPAALCEAIYQVELGRRAVARNATFAQLLAQAEARKSKNQRDKDPGLSKAELVAIYEYTTDEDFITGFNRLTREDPRAAMEVHGGFIDVLRKALDKLEPYKGQVWRGSGVLSDPEMAIITTEGATFRPGYFWSTATDPKGLKGHADRIVFDIRSQTGKNIAWLSAKENEYEALFAPNAAFRVERANQNPLNGHWAVRLTDLGRPEDG